MLFLSPSWLSQWRWSRFVCSHSPGGVFLPALLHSICCVWGNICIYSRLTLNVPVWKSMLCKTHLVFSSLLFSWSSQQLILLGRLDLSPAPDWLRTLSSVMSYLDCGLNPLIYCSHQDFREAGLALLWTHRKPSSEPVLTAITKHEWQTHESINNYSSESSHGEPNNDACAYPESVCTL